MVTKVPDNPTEGQRVQTEHGNAVFTGCCWVEADLYDAMEAQDRQPQEPPPVPELGNDMELEVEDNRLYITEVGTCKCGAPWGNSVKWVTCVFCGQMVSLT